MASNDEWIIPADTEERRFAVFEVSSKHRQDKTYFDALYAEQQDGGLEAMLYDLLQMDILNWHPRNNFPKTDALKDQMITNLPPIEKAWFNCLVTGECEFVGSARDAYHLATNAFTKACARYAQYTKPPSEHAVAAFFGAPRLNADGSMRQARSMGFDKEGTLRPRGFWIPELHIARKRWDEIMFTHQWDDIQTWHNTSQCNPNQGDMPF